MEVVPVENLNERKKVEAWYLCERRHGRGVDLNRNWSVDWGKKEKVVNEQADVQCSVVEMSTQLKLSCLSWNKYTKNHTGSSDYESIVTVWDITTRQSVMEYEEHEKRAWSLYFSLTDPPAMLVSGSDDCKVKIWCTRQEVGSADHHIHYYDLRNISQPLHIFSGHRKAVSYVKFLSNHELASASTDSTLRLWDVRQNIPRTCEREELRGPNCK